MHSTCQESGVNALWMTPPPCSKILRRRSLKMIRVAPRIVYVSGIYLTPARPLVCSLRHATTRVHAASDAPFVFRRGRTHVAGVLLNVPERVCEKFFEKVPAVGRNGGSEGPWRLRPSAIRGRPTMSDGHAASAQGASPCHPSRAALRAVSRSSPTGPNAMTSRPRVAAIHRRASKAP